MKKLIAPWQIDLTGIAAILVLTAGVWFAGVRPVLARQARDVATQQNFVASHQKLRETENEVASLTAQLKASQKDRASRGQILEPVSHLNRRIASFTDLATHSGATLDDVQPGRPSPGARFDLVPIHLAGTGTYPQFSAFVHAIRAAHPDVGIGAFAVSGTPATTNLPATFTVELSWYTQPTMQKPAPK